MHLSGRRADRGPGLSRTDGVMRADPTPAARAGPADVWRLGGGARVVLDRPRVMGILNVTPDSFSDGGQWLDPARAAAHAAAMVSAGADMLDIGGESTRPGAGRVPASEQIRRVVPVVRAVRAAGIGVPITIDTTLAAVAEAGLDAGADGINDVSGGLDDATMLAVAARRECGIVLMHRLRAPADDRYSTGYNAEPEYAGGVVREVRERLAGMLEAARAAGVEAERVLLDPGLGFGKSVGQNLALVRSMAELAGVGRPMLGAASRKSFVGRVSGEPAEGGASLGGAWGPVGRMAGSIAFALAMLTRGVRTFRVHDVAEHRRALDAAWAIEGPG